MDQKTIVLIEDDETLSQVLASELSDVGYTVERAFNGKEGITMVSEKKPHLVLLDIIMPQKGGFEVLEALKANDATKDIPVMMLTMLGREMDVQKGMDLGAVDYIVKSQHATEDIVSKVKTFLEPKEQ